MAHPLNCLPFCLDGCRSTGCMPGSFRPPQPHGQTSARYFIFFPQIPIILYSPFAKVRCFPLVLQSQQLMAVIVALMFHLVRVWNCSVAVRERLESIMLSQGLIQLTVFTLLFPITLVFMLFKGLFSLCSSKKRLNPKVGHIAI